MKDVRKLSSARREILKLALILRGSKRRTRRSREDALSLALLSGYAFNNMFEVVESGKLRVLRLR